MGIQIGEVGSDLRVEAGYVDGPQPGADFDGRRGDPSHAHQFASKRIELVDVAAFECPCFNSSIDRVAGVLQLRNDRDVVVENECHQLVQDVVDTEAQQIGIGLAARPNRRIGGRGASSDGNDVVRSQKDVAMTKNHALANQFGRAKYDEQ